MERGKSNSNEEDRDFIDFWRAITHYFALYVCLARYFQSFWKDREVLLEYLIERGLIICADEDYVDILYLMSNFYDEIRQRGTMQVVRAKGYQLPSISNNNSNSQSTSTSQSQSGSESKEVNGEYLRLICYDERDEFLFNLNKNSQVGWVVNSSSPNYKGLYGRMNLNKFYSDTLKNISSLPIINPVYCSIITDSGNKVLSISGVPNGQIAGLGAFDENLLISVNANLDYEITFLVKQEGISSGNLSFGFLSYDLNNNSLQSKDFINNINSNLFLDKVELVRDDKYILVRGIIYGKNQFSDHNVLNTYPANRYVKNGINYYKAIKNVPENILITDTVYWQQLTPQNIIDLTSVLSQRGINLKFNEINNTVKIIPYIVLDNTSSGDGSLKIYQIRINPLKTDYSKGVIQTTNLIEIWNTNNNQSVSEIDIERTAKKYLFPYNIQLKENYLPSVIQ